MEKVQLQALASYKSSTKALELKYRAELQEKQSKHNDRIKLLEELKNRKPRKKERTYHGREP